MHLQFRDYNSLKTSHFLANSDIILGILAKEYKKLYNLKLVNFVLLKRLVKQLGSRNGQG